MHSLGEAFVGEALEVRKRQPEQEGEEEDELEYLAEIGGWSSNERKEGRDERVTKETRE